MKRSPIFVTPGYIDEALESYSFGKAISWDFLTDEFPKSIKGIKKRLKADYEWLVLQLERLCHAMLARDELPEEFFTSRLLCLNKKARNRVR